MSLELYNLAATGDLNAIKALLGKQEVFRLFSNKLDINYFNRETEHSVLSIAIANGHEQVVNYLLELPSIKPGVLEISYAQNEEATATKILDKALENEANLKSTEFFIGIMNISLSYLMQKIIPFISKQGFLYLVKSIDDPTKSIFWVNVAILAYKNQNNTQYSSLIEDGIDRGYLPNIWGNLSKSLGKNLNQNQLDEFFSYIFKQEKYSQFYMGLVLAYDHIFFAKYLENAPPKVKHNLMVLLVKHSKHAKYGLYPEVEYLLGRGISPELRTAFDGRYASDYNTKYKINGSQLVKHFPTLLHIAAADGDPKMISLLLKAGAYSMPLSYVPTNLPLAKDCAEIVIAKPIFFAVGSKNAAQIIQIFLEHAKTLPDNNTERYSKEELDLLGHFAIKMRSPEGDELYLYIKNFRKTYRTTNDDIINEEDLILMVKNARTKLIIDYLEESPLACNARLSKGLNLLQTACAIGNLDTVKALIERGADVNARNEGLTPLQLAVKEKHLAVAEYLLEQKNYPVKFNAINHLGQSALHLAEGDPSFYELLLKYGADSNITDHEGNPPRRPKKLKNSDKKIPVAESIAIIPVNSQTDMHVEAQPQPEMTMVSPVRPAFYKPRPVSTEVDLIDLAPDTKISMPTDTHNFTLDLMNSEWEENPRIDREIIEMETIVPESSSSTANNRVEHSLTLSPPKPQRKSNQINIEV